MNDILTLEVLGAVFVLCVVNVLYLTARSAERLSLLAHDKAIDALIRVGALEKSTHRVQFMPMEQVLAKNEVAKEKLAKLFNPGNEDFDWNLPFEDESEEEPTEDEEPMMPNAAFKAALAKQRFESGAK